MGCHHRNFFHESAMEFPRSGFWIIHLIGGLLLFILGMRFALSRASIPLLAYRLVRMLIPR